MNKGFTLIELLIVVAIIAILAAIAVPNFMEAQTRAKVSRVRSDHRSLATAMESYMVDYNSYTNCDWGNAVPTGWKQLTTPVGYITTLPTDPFGDSRHKTKPNSSFLQAKYELGTGRAGVAPSGRPGHENESAFRGGMPSNTYEMNSNGPDKRDDTHNPKNTGKHLPWSDGKYPWVKNDPNSPEAIEDILSIIYDTTNGTKSGGDVLRVGGTKPAGLAFDLLFSHASGQ